MRYPDEPIGPVDAPPLRFDDREGREIAIHAYGRGPVGSHEGAGDADREGSGSADGAAGDADREAAEFEALVEMYVAFDPADRAQGIPPTEERDIRPWLRSVLGAESVNVVAWHNDHAIGHATLVADGDGAYELAIFVLDDYQRAGIGTRLMEGLLGQGRREGVERVWLTVERWNEAAVALYEKMGFEPADGEAFELEMTGRLA